MVTFTSLITPFISWLHTPMFTPTFTLNISTYCLPAHRPHSPHKSSSTSLSSIPFHNFPYTTLVSSVILPSPLKNTGTDASPSHMFSQLWFCHAVSCFHQSSDYQWLPFTYSRFRHHPTRFLELTIFWAGWKIPPACLAVDYTGNWGKMKLSVLENIFLTSVVLLSYD